MRSRRSWRPRGSRDSNGGLRRDDGRAGALQRDREGVGERGFGGDVAQIDAQMHDGLRNLRTDAADDAVRAHQARGGDGLEQMLGDQRVDGRHAGDVDDRETRTGIDDLLQQALHHHLGARRIERADQRQRENAFPQLHDRCREFEQFFLLARDDRLAAFLEGFGGVEAEAVEQQIDRPAQVGEFGGLARERLAQPRVERLLEREHEGGGLDRRVALTRAVRGHVGEKGAHRLPFGTRRVERVGARERVEKNVEEGGELLADFGFHRQTAAQGDRQMQADPVGQQGVAMLIQDVREAAPIGRGHTISPLVFGGLIFETNRCTLHHPRD
ncbi:hypothetical protein PT2222_80317 [Paraburkholderia tropica]